MPAYIPQAKAWGNLGGKMGKILPQSNPKIFKIIQIVFTAVATAENIAIGRSFLEKEAVSRCGHQIEMETFVSNG